MNMVLCLAVVCMAVTVYLYAADAAQSDKEKPAATAWMIEQPKAAAPEKSGAAGAKKEAAPPAVPKKAAAPAEKSYKDMTVDELAARISATIDRFAEVMDYIPGLKAEMDPEGTAYYTLDRTRLDKLGKERLVALYRRVNQERTRISTERITRQLEMIRQANQAVDIARQAGSRALPPAPPPVPPSAPPQAAQPPRTPPQPPPQPRR